MTAAELFETLLHQETVIIPEGWAQGRATYGGLVAALLYARMAAVQGSSMVLRSASVSFVAPVAPGPATVTARILRQGKSVVQMEAQLRQGEDVMAAMLASFGAPRESALSVAALPAPVFPAPDAARSFTHIPGITPEFLQHFDVRWAHGDLPFTGSDRAELGGWVRLQSRRAAFDYTDLFLLADVWPPAVLPIVPGVAPGSSLSWTLEPIQLPPGKTGGNWWQYRASTDYFHDGYGHCAAHIWDEDGRLVALSRQTVVVFA
ncbi:MAG TPA: thioesterase family protein [Moraxellaceae bacterium]|nr:thioesterase family protein [Moraxellaceae bacterium]